MYEFILYDESQGEMSMFIEVAALRDVDKIMILIQKCIEDMEAQGIYQWNEHYPTRDIIVNDIKDKSLFCLKENGNITGVISVSEEYPLEYNKLKWLSKNSKVLAVHRLAIEPKRQKQGRGRRLMEFVETCAIENGYGSIRLDAYSGNPGVLSFYEGQGYQKVGELIFPYRELPFCCYEKVLPSNK